MPPENPILEASLLFASFPSKKNLLILLERDSISEHFSDKSGTGTRAIGKGGQRIRRTPFFHLLRK